MADSSPLLDAPVEVWDRILFWMSLSPLDVANFAKSSRRCHFLAFGPVGDRNEYNVLQHGALLGELLTEKVDDDMHQCTYFKYLYDTDHVDRALFAIMRMSSRASAASVLEVLYFGLHIEEPHGFDGETLFSLLSAGGFAPRTRKLLRRIGEGFGPADFTSRIVIDMVGALSGFRYEGMPRKSSQSVAKFAIIGGHPELLAQLLTQLFDEANKYITVRSGCYDFLQTAARLEQCECFEIAFNFIVSHFDPGKHSGWPQGILTPIVESTNAGLRRNADADSFPFYSLVFNAVAEKRLWAHPRSVKRCWRELASPFLESPRAAELMAIVAGSSTLRRILRKLIKAPGNSGFQKVLPIVELAVGAGIKLPFASIATAVAAAQPETLAKIVFRAKLLNLERYPRWFSKTILFPVCAGRDWPKLRREVEDFAEDFYQKAVGECYMSLMESVARARDAVGDDGGVEAAREIVAAFTPELFPARF